MSRPTLDLPETTDDPWSQAPSDPLTILGNRGYFASVVANVYPSYCAKGDARLIAAAPAMFIAIRETAKLLRAANMHAYAANLEAVIKGLSHD